MGHLGNPIALRLSLKKKWQFNFFVKPIYYPEFINNIINIRDYIYYYLTSKFLVRTGLCLSHLLLFKYAKQIYIKIFIYHIAIEKNSYDYMNALYENYFEAYNKVTFKSDKNKNKNKNEDKDKEEDKDNEEEQKVPLKLDQGTINNVRYLQSADLFLFYCICINFYNVNAKKEPKLQYLKNNIYINNEIKIKEYSSYIIYLYFKKYISYIKKRWENKPISFIYKNGLNKINRKVRHSAIKRRYFLYWFFKLYKKKIKFLLNSKSSLKIKTLYDVKFNNKLNWNNFSGVKLNVLSLFLFLAKKVNFQKVQNAKTLKSKWLKIANYIKLFYLTNSLDLKNSGFISIQSFLYLLYVFIYISKLSALNINVRFNLKDALYNCLYFGLYHMGYGNWFKHLIYVLKYDINTVSNSINVKNTLISFLFLTNHNITSQIISRYIALKLLKGFSLKKIVTPLKRELIYQSYISRGVQFSTKIKNYKWQNNMRNLIIKKWFNSYMKYYFVFFLINYFNTFKLNDTLIFTNIFYDKYKNRSKRKSNMFRLHLYTKKIMQSWEDKVTFVLKKNRKTKFQTYREFTKKVKANIKYALLFNVNKKELSTIYKVHSMHSIENAFFNSFKFLNTIYKFVIKKKINNMNIYVSSFFCTNYINFSLIKILWSLYTRYNLRNMRQEYIPAFNSSILGFKLILKGRFSRKLRASKSVLMIGRIPLNNFNVKIDYTFLTIPITNSAISIKVYIYKNPIFENYKKIVTH